MSTISAYRWAGVRQAAAVSRPAADFAAFYQDHASSVLLYFAKRTFDPELALDLTAETFAQALSVRRRFRGSTHNDERAWLFGIARHVLLRSLRRSRAEDRAVRRLRLERVVLEADDAARIVQQAELGDRRRSLAAELIALPASQREAVWLRVVDELTYEEVARRLAITEVCARRRVSRGLATLARTLELPSRRSESNP